MSISLPLGQEQLEGVIRKARKAREVDQLELALSPVGDGGALCCAVAREFGNALSWNLMELMELGGMAVNAYSARRGNTSPTGRW